MHIIREALTPAFAAAACKLSMTGAALHLQVDGAEVSKHNVANDCGHLEHSENHAARLLKAKGWNGDYAGC